MVTAIAAAAAFLQCIQYVTQWQGVTTLQQKTIRQPLLTDI